MCIWLFLLYLRLVFHLPTWVHPSLLEIAYMLSQYLNLYIFLVFKTHWKTSPKISKKSTGINPYTTKLSTFPAIFPIHRSTIHKTVFLRFNYRFSQLKTHNKNPIFLKHTLNTNSPFSSSSETSTMCLRRNETTTKMIKRVSFCLIHSKTFLFFFFLR